jgi:hypothetical protein
MIWLEIDAAASKGGGINLFHLQNWESHVEVKFWFQNQGLTHGFRFVLGIREVRCDFRSSKIRYRDDVWPGPEKS